MTHVTTYQTIGSSALSLNTLNPRSSSSLATCDLRLVQGTHSNFNQNYNQFSASSKPMVSSEQLLATQITVICMGFLMLAMWFFL